MSFDRLDRPFETAFVDREIFENEHRADEIRGRLADDVQPEPTKSDAPEADAA